MKTITYDGEVRKPSAVEEITTMVVATVAGAASIMTPGCSMTVVGASGDAVVGIIYDQKYTPSELKKLMVYENYPVTLKVLNHFLIVK